MSTPRLFSSKLLAQVGKLIDQLTDEEAEAIAAGSAWLTLTVERPPPKAPRTVAAGGRKPKAPPQSKPALNIEALVQTLQQCSSRDAARSVLQNAGKLAKADLTSILAILGESTKEATIAKLTERIVEATAGVRVDTKSILGRQYQ